MKFAPKDGFDGLTVKLSGEPLTGSVFVFLTQKTTDATNIQDIKQAGMFWLEVSGGEGSWTLDVIPPGT